ncbi:hypothetical protein, partial [Enterobacter cloacae]|uniref:hypothetical protein n=1 Tax=Enterobacter cloacae TaxID=550 RepID=UPI00195489EB
MINLTDFSKFDNWLAVCPARGLSEEAGGINPARLGPVHAVLTSDFRVMMLIVIMGQITVNDIVKG